MGKKILIADDDASLRKLIKTSLELGNEMFEIYEADSGNNALEMARKIKPELLILDVMMPGMSGYEVCRNLKDSQETRNIYVLFLTGRGSDLSRKTIENCGGDDIMTKPFPLIELERKVKKVFGSA